MSKDIVNDNYSEQHISALGENPLPATVEVKFSSSNVWPNGEGIKLGRDIVPIEQDYKDKVIKIIKTDLERAKKAIEHAGDAATVCRYEGQIGAYEYLLALIN